MLKISISLVSVVSSFNHVLSFLSVSSGRNIPGDLAIDMCLCVVSYCPTAFFKGLVDFLSLSLKRRDQKAVSEDQSLTSTVFLETSL